MCKLCTFSKRNGNFLNKLLKNTFYRMWRIKNIKIITSGSGGVGTVDSERLLYNLFWV